MPTNNILNKKHANIRKIALFLYFLHIFFPNNKQFTENKKTVLHIYHCKTVSK